MKTYRYKGQAVGAAGDLLLCPGSSYKLNPKDRHVVTLVAKGLLEEEKKIKKLKKNK